MIPGITYLVLCIHIHHLGLPYLEIYAIPITSMISFNIEHDVSLNFLNIYVKFIIVPYDLTS